MMVARLEIDAKVLLAESCAFNKKRKRRRIATPFKGELLVSLLILSNQFRRVEAEAITWGFWQVVRADSKSRFK
jgi:hypothetical protein